MYLGFTKSLHRSYICIKIFTYSDDKQELKSKNSSNPIVMNINTSLEAIHARKSITLEVYIIFVKIAIKDKK
jgi:hypothetical protein